jgi:hypothetical protein
VFTFLTGSHCKSRPNTTLKARGDAARLVRFSEIVDKYGLRLSLFQPDWPSNTTVKLFSTMKRIDAVLHEGGGGPVLPGLGVTPGRRLISVEAVLQNLEGIAHAVRKHGAR